METGVKYVKKLLLAPSNLSEQKLEKLLGKVVSSRYIDYADVYLQSIYSESWLLEDGRVRQGLSNTHRGFGLRVVRGEKTGFAYADDISGSALDQAVHAAKHIVSTDGERGPHALAVPTPSESVTLYPGINPLICWNDAKKIDLLQKIDQHARAIDSRIKQVIVSLSGRYEIVLLMNNQGELFHDLRPLVCLSIRVVAEENGRRESAYSGSGRRSDYNFFINDANAKRIASKVVRQALLNLKAVSAPAGTMPVVLGPGWPGILLHEAVGHGLEGDFNRKGSSAFSNRLGKRVASPVCTVVDDGTLSGRCGSLNVDDEGTVTQNTVLIENGILKNYMQDRHNASLMKMKSTGNGRRESYAHLPIPRMTNTYMLSGENEPCDIIASVGKGIYAVDFSSGQVDITSGKFVFSTSEAYLIEHGKITAPLKGVTLIGNGLDVLMRISMIGNDLALDSGIGYCGKAGQTIPVGVGQPTLKIDQLTVGGVNY